MTDTVKGFAHVQQDHGCSFLLINVACISCSSSTNYVCLSCKKSACNKSKDCSVPADEETPGWKAGVSVAYCLSCFKKKTEKGKQPKKEAKPLKHDKKQKELPTRKCLSLCEKVEVIHASKELECETVGKEIWMHSRAMDFKWYRTSQEEQQ